MWRLKIVGLALSTVGRLPLPVIQHLGAGLGWWLWRSRSRMALVTRENLALCFPDMPDAARDALARASLAETGKTTLESAFAWTSPPARCLAAIRQVQGRREVDLALAEGRGLILIVPHLGNWEVLNHYAGRELAPTHMYQPNRSRSLNAMIQQWRERTGARFVEAGRAGIRAQLAALSAGGSVSAMPDQEPEVHTGQFAPFFGVSCLSNTLVPNLALHTGAAVFVAYCQRLDKGSGFRIVFTRLDLAGRDANETLAALNAGIEAAVRRVPEQYLWSYKRFRTRPAGLPELYQFRQHPTRAALESAAIRLAIRCARLLPLSVLRRAGAIAGDALRLAHTRYARQARVNLHLCAAGLHLDDTRSVEQQSLRELGRTVMETTKIWGASDEEFDAMTIVNGLEYLYDGATIVLTPPLGNREVLLRALAGRYRVTEYYHPHSKSALDDAIRRQRRLCHIALAPHTLAGLDTLKKKLAAGEVVTLCPDQQPRLRWGEFIPLFGVPALTASAMACLIADSDAVVVIGAAVRDRYGFQVMLQPCPIPSRDDSRGILREINAQLEQVIAANVDQYRWSDKRFNIRPAGQGKVYSQSRA